MAITETNSYGCVIAAHDNCLAIHCALEEAFHRKNGAGKCAGALNQVAHYSHHWMPRYVPTHLVAFRDSWQQNTLPEDLADWIAVCWRTHEILIDVHLQLLQHR
jgi:hypothetical protein